jgi:phosphate/sulfate permease
MLRIRWLTGLLNKKQGLAIMPIVAVGISLVLAFSLVFLFVYTKKYEETNKESLIAMSAQTMSYLSADILQEVSPTINMIELLSDFIGDFPKEYLKEFFKGLLASNSLAADVCYGSAKPYRDGGFYEGCSDWKPYEDPEYAGWDHLERPWFKIAAQNKGKLIITEPYIEALEKKLVVTPTKTVENSKGEFIGVIASCIYLDMLDSVVSARKITEDGESYLLDAKGLYLTGGDKILKYNFFDDLGRDFAMEQVFSSKDSIFFSEKDYLAVSRLKGTDWFIVSKGSLAVLHKSSVLNVLAVIAIVVIIGIFWSASVYMALKESHVKEMLKEKEFARNLVFVRRTHYQEMKDMHDTLRILHHDFKHHIKVIDELLQAGHVRETKQYLTRYKEQMPESNFSYYCHNQTINALLSSYAKRCKELSIQYKVRIELPETFSIPDYDVCIILGNLLENALEASQKIETGREIELAIKTNALRLTIMVKNSFNGVVSKKEGELASTKKDGGLGLPGIRAVVDAYNGHVTTEWSKNAFTAYVMLNFTV